MIRKGIHSLCVALCLSAFSPAVQSEETRSPLPVLTEGTLANGLGYTLVPVHSDKGRIDIRLGVDAGSLDETDAQSGVAHMVEHMVFRASEAWPEGVAEALAKQGWKRGLHYNAVTNYERTQYMMSPPNGTKGLDTSLNALAQMVAHARLTQTDLDDERKIILEEWRGKLGVATRMNAQRIAALRDGSRYPQRVTIGSEDAINTMPATQLQAFYQRWYHPNNMRLMIIGDIKPADVQELIVRHFGALPSVALPERTLAWYNQKLESQLRVVRLQDSESGGSQVSWVNRIDDPKASDDGEYRHRLINQITLSALTRQLKRQRDLLPTSVGNVVVRKSDIGRTTVAFGLFADTLPGEHSKALDTLIRERERLIRFGVSEKDVENVKADIRETALKMKAAPEKRAFADWVQMLAIAWQNRNAYVPTQTRAVRALAELDGITAADINTRLRSWLQAPDQLVQFSIPGKTEASLPDAAAIEQRVQTIAAEKLQPTPAEKTTALAPLPVRDTAGKRVAVTRFAKEKVEEWTLSNGDRVVWLRTPLAKNTVRVNAHSQAGYLSQGLVAWQAQLASQLVDQSGPAGWSSADMQRWKADNALSLSVTQEAWSLEVSGQSPVDKIDALFHRYQLLHTDANIDADSMKDSIMSLARRQVMQQGSLSAERSKSTVALRYGKPAFTEPTEAELLSLTVKDLLAQWQTTRRAPVTWFILADMPADKLKKSVEHYLAGIVRDKPLNAAPWLPLPGQREQQEALNIEPKADVRLWSFSETPWSPEKAVQVSIARNLANQQLKTALRDDARGVYNLLFNSELNDKDNRIESELRFTTSSERAQELAVRAEQALKDAPGQITAQMVDNERQAFRRTEQTRAQDITTVQRRLILSYRHFNSPEYLSRLNTLDQAITLEGVRAMAERLYNPDNRVLYTVLPQETQP
ncbi:zinc protease [Enterobacter sp. BIGb0383]|uniref:M16 family metallopeptidase n=1 Tax=unclassified Enterobacter TaxID=2608935 RepID=UPI000F46CE39|nr:MULTISPECIES: M16 family metallopeptidase [unclassified Enterobacter]ROP59460.1 zinc protease [Enterobacter sp. BIGb0383]ROS09073.1 zinc protease [Enterobacter sp. BIGb0359]